MRTESPLMSFQSHVAFLIKNDRFFLEFSPQLKQVELDTETIRPLLRRVREICDLSECPAGRPDCRGCARSEELVGEGVKLSPFWSSIRKSFPDFLFPRLFRSVRPTATH